VPMNAPMWCCSAAHSARQRLQCPHRPECAWFRLREPERFPPGSTHSRGHRCDRILGRGRYAEDSQHYCGSGRPSRG
jgi:hypothetical protein